MLSALEAVHRGGEKCPDMGNIGHAVLTSDPLIAELGGEGGGGAGSEGGC